FQGTSSESIPDSDEYNSRRQLQCDERLPTSNSSDDEACLQALQAAEGQSGGGLQFQLTPYTVRHRPSFGVTWQTYRGRLQGQPSSGDASEEVIRALGQAIRDQSQPWHDDDYLQIYLGSNRLANNFTSARIRVRDWRHTQGPARHLLEQMTALLNSNENFAVDDAFVVDLTYVRPPRGTGRRKLGSDAFANMVKSKHSCLEIKNKDDLCCARALVTARAYQHKDQSALHLSEYTTLRHGGALQTTKARELHRLAKVPEGPCGLPELREFEKVLPEYQLIVVSADHGNAIVHCGPTALHQLILLAHQGHYDVITKLNAYFGVAYFCLRCRKGYNTKDYQHHRCPGFKCYCCQQTDCSDFATHPARDAATELCPHCHRRFFGPRCLELHTLRSPSGARVHPLTFDNVCAQLRCCGHCGRTFQSYQAFLSHLCGYQPCYNCGLTVDVWDHQCFIQAIPLRRGPKRKHATTSSGQPGPVPEEQPIVKIFFDCECMQEGGEAHRVNLVCAETSLDDQRYQFPSMQEFMAWVWHLRVTDPGRRPFVVIAHNFQGYDGYLLLEELYRQAVAPGVPSRVQPANRTAQILPIRRADPETGVYPLRAGIQGYVRVRPLRTMYHHRLGVQHGLPSPLDAAPNPGRRTPARLASTDPSIESRLGMVNAVRRQPPSHRTERPRQDAPFRAATQDLLHGPRQTGAGGHDRHDVPLRLSAQSGHRGRHGVVGAVLGHRLSLRRL
ncbi:unnamed protein product, partial [Porites lobata]